jgi:Outer membrane protein
MKKIIIPILIGIITLPVFSQNVLTLEKCKELAQKNNLKMQNAELTVEAAQQQKKEAFTKYFPSISATGMGFATNKPMLSMEMDMAGQMQPLTDVLGPLIGWGMANGAPIDPALLEAMQNQDPTKIEALNNGIVGGVMAMQPIFAGGQIVNGNRLAKAGVEIRQLQKQMTDKEVLLTTEQYFWQIVLLKEKLKTIDNAVVMLDRIFSDVKVSVEAGLTTRNDQLRVELEQNKLASNKLKVENGLRILKTSFALHIGLEIGDYDIETPNIENTSLPAKQDNKALLENRLEYRLLDKSVDIAKLEVKLETGKNMPSVAVGAGYQYMKFDINKSGEMKNDFGMVFAMVSVPITDWWGGSHAIKRKKIDLKIAENTRQETSDLLLLQMQKTDNELDEAFQQILIAKKSIISSEENLRISNDNFSVGVTTLSDLLEAQNLVQQSHDQYTEAAALYYIKLAEYKQMSE